MTNITNYSSPNFDESPSVHHVIRSIWLSIVFVLGTIGNLLLFSVILQKKRITNVANLFNLNLAVGDLIRIFVFIPVYLVYSANDEWPIGLIGCRSITMIVQSSMTVSIVTLMFMSMERYQAVIHPLKKQMSIRLARYLVVISWAVGFVTSLWFAMSLDLVSDHNGRVHCSADLKRSWKTHALLLLIPVTQWLPGIVFMVAYIKIILKLRRNAVINPSDVSQSSQNRHRRNIRAARILVIEAVLFLACLFPFYQHSLAMIVGDIGDFGPLSVKGMFVNCMMMTYSLINPFCHILLNSEFRSEVVKMRHQLKGVFGLRRNRVNECSHCHLKECHLNHEELQTYKERTNATPVK